MTKSLKSLSYASSATWVLSYRSASTVVSKAFATLMSAGSAIFDFPTSTCPMCGCERFVNEASFSCVYLNFES